MKALIFDMDGTLVDNMAFHHLARIVLLNKYGISLSLEESRSIREVSFSSVIKKFLKYHVSDEEINALNNEKQLIYRILYEKHIKEIKGLKQLLHSSKEKGYSIALATMGSSDNIAFTLNKLEVLQYFDIIISGENVNKAKPHPDIYNSTISALNVNAKETIVFEDSHAGVKAAQKAGIEVIGVCSSHPKEQFKAWGVCHSINSYEEYLENYFA
jgi:beta-phosphoglucomutase